MVSSSGFFKKSFQYWLSGYGKLGEIGNGSSLRGCIFSVMVVRIW